MLAAARGGQCLLTRLAKTGLAAKQGHASVFTFPLAKEWKKLLQPPPPSLPNLDSFLLRRVYAFHYSTLGDDDVDLVNQNQVYPVSLVSEELACLAQNLRMRVTAELLHAPSLAIAAEYFFKLGVEGKSFRPVLLMLMASSLSLLPSPTLDLKVESDDRRICQFRVVEITELIHVASLVHDDVIDESESRRGISSLNHNIVNKLAVLAGDFLLAKASVGLSTLEAMALLSDSLAHIVTGEVMQLTANTQQSCSMQDYLQKTYLKTASLIASSCKSIALLADQPQDVAMLAFEYGRHMRIAYRLVDDALGFTGTSATLGKPALTDLREGIITAPILFALQEEPLVRAMIDRKFTEDGDHHMAVKLVNKTRGVAQTLDLASKHAQLAETCITQFPPCSDFRSQQCRQALADLTRWVVKRSK